MKTIWNRLMEEPALLASAVVILVNRIGEPLGLPPAVADGVVDLVALLAGVAVRSAVSPDRKRDRLAKEGPQVNPELLRGRR